MVRILKTSRATPAKVNATCPPEQAIDASAPVTIGIAAYNASDVIIDAVLSVIAQSYSAWRLVVVDDGSTDDTAAKLCMIRDDRISVISDGNNMGLAARLNQIAQASRSEFLFRMDADDVMHPRRVEKQLAYMREHPEVDVLGTRAYVIDDFKRVRGMFKEADLGIQSSDWLEACGLSHPSICMRTSWARANPYDQKLRRSDDLELWARTASTSTFAKIEDALLFYRVPKRINLANYRLDKVTERIVIRRIAKSRGLGGIRTVRLLIRSWVQEKVMVALVASHTDSFLQSRKAASLPSEALITAQRDLQLALGRRTFSGDLGRPT